MECGSSTIELTPGSPVNLTSPLYPNNYPLLTTCEYSISAPEGYKVLVEFLDVELEFAWDKFYIGNSIITGDTPPANYTSVNETLEIKFSSDEVYALRGFLVRLSAIDVSGRHLLN